MNIFQRVTLKNLKENRTRTLVTIVGIILSAAMFTAVTVSISSLRHYLVAHTIYETGSWYGAAFDISEERADSLSTNSEVSELIRMKHLGYALLPDSLNENKPYLCVYGIDKDFTSLMPVHLTKGRMPENSSEILLPEHLFANGGISHKLNDSLSLELGDRTAENGEALNNQASYSPSEDSTEKLINTRSCTYTVVGFYERPDFESYSAPGYTALTISDTTAGGIYDVYFCTENISEISDFMNKTFSTYDEGVAWTMNYDLLRLSGASGESAYTIVLRNLGIILCLIIFLGSVSLIYNAFSISVSERTRQFGLLSSIGATKKQLTGSVLFEAFFLSIIGIPLGILSGIAGIGITFYFTRDMITDFLFSGSPTVLKLYPSLPALMITVFISLITILISAWIPARRAMKGSAIDAIRQIQDITIRPGKVKTNRLTYRLFGFEGMLASKNFKRNRGKYRTTVISLFLSIVLFISTSSFCAYLQKSASDILLTYDYDLAYSLAPDSKVSPETLFTKLSAVSGVASGSYNIPLYLYGTVSTSALSKDYIKYCMPDQTLDNPNTFTTFSVFFVRDNVFRDCLKQNNLSETEYFNPAAPKAVMLDNSTLYIDGKYYTFSSLSSFKNCKALLHLPMHKEGYTDYGSGFDNKGNVLYTYALSDSTEDDSSETIDLPIEECGVQIPVTIGASLSSPPDNTTYYNEGINLFYPYSMMDHLFAGLDKSHTYRGLPDELPFSSHSYCRLTFRAKDHAQAATDMRKILTDLKLPPEQLVDYAVSADQERALLTVINIFSYGFIILISLIAAANVFNTISTNIILRKREFAMLKSIGLAPEDFRKMMNFECLLYGFKGLIYGLPVSVAVTWLIYRAVSGGIEMQFFIPWYSLVLAIGSVFLVVFSTMLYSTHKIKRENIMDILKDENI